MAEWTPTLLEVFQGTLAVLNEVERPYLDALFLHGSPIRDDKLDELVLDRAVRAYADEHSVGCIVLNGLPHKECVRRNLAYHGYEQWRKYLIRECVREEDIILLEPCVHTGAESRAFLELAEEQGWQEIGICTQGFHQLRCFLQIVALMAEVGYEPKVYNLPASGILPLTPLHKPVLAGGTVVTEDVTGTLATMVAAELERIQVYAQQPTPERMFTRHATIPEMLAYLLNGRSE